MAKPPQLSPDPDDRSYRCYRNAVERYGTPARSTSLPTASASPHSPSAASRTSGGRWRCSAPASSPSPRTSRRWSSSSTTPTTRRALVEDGSVAPEYLRETVGELVPLAQAIVGASTDDESVGLGEDELDTYAAERHTDRMAQIADSDAELPCVEELTRLE